MIPHAVHWLFFYPFTLRLSFACVGRGPNYNEETQTREMSSGIHAMPCSAPSMTVNSNLPSCESLDTGPRLGGVTKELERRRHRAAKAEILRI